MCCSETSAFASFIHERKESQIHNITDKTVLNYIHTESHLVDSEYSLVNGLQWVQIQMLVNADAGVKINTLGLGAFSLFCSFMHEEKSLTKD